jgi:FMN phosphatase YigB (HAD superfamily)
MGLVAAGGWAFVGAAASDAWQAARAGMVRLFGRGGQRRQELAERWADQTAAEIEQAAEEERPQVRQRLAPVWRQRLADLVEEYPEVTEELRAWAQRLQSELPAAQHSWVHTYIARDHAQQYNAPHGTINVNPSPGSSSPS